jgi:hypothetical protein
MTIVANDNHLEDHPTTAEWQHYREVIRRELAQAYANAWNDPGVSRYLGIYDGKDAASALVGSFHNIIDEVCKAQEHVWLAGHRPFAVGTRLA